MTAYDDMRRLLAEALRAHGDAQDRCEVVLEAAVHAIVSGMGVPRGAWECFAPGATSDELGEKRPPRLAATQTAEGEWVVFLVVYPAPERPGDPAINFRLRARPTEVGAELTFGDRTFDWKASLRLLNEHGAIGVDGLDGLAEAAARESVKFFEAARDSFLGRSPPGGRIGFKRDV